MIDVIAHYWLSSQIPMWANFLGAVIPIALGIYALVLIIKMRKNNNHRR